MMFCNMLVCRVGVVNPVCKYEHSGLQLRCLSWTLSSIGLFIYCIIIIFFSPIVPNIVYYDENLIIVMIMIM